MISSKLIVKNVMICMFVLAFSFVFGSASAEIKVSDNLSLSGFVDMSSKITDDGKEDSESAASLSLDEFELDLHFSSGSVTGRVDLDNSSGSVGVEQGFVTYALPEDILSDASISAGRFLSSLGFEGAEPTDLYQISSSGAPYPLYQNGVRVNVDPHEQIKISASVLSGVWNVEDEDVKDPGFEVQVSVSPIENLIAKAGYAFEDIAVGNADETKSLINAFAQFTEGDLTVAGEYNLLKNWGVNAEDGTVGSVEDGVHFLAMANMSLESVLDAPVAITARFSSIKMDADEEAATAITVCPSYQASDDWTLLAEYRVNSDDSSQIAIESLFTF